MFALLSSNFRIVPVNYTHTQKAPLHLILHALAFAFIAAGLFFPADFAALIGLWTGAAVIVLFANMFRELTVADEGNRLAIRYGPIPLFFKTIEYSEIRAVERDRTALVDGWGIHWVPGRGWTYNLWGFDCVKLDVNGKTIRVGSDDADKLVEFLRSQIKPAG